MSVIQHTDHNVHPQCVAFLHNLMQPHHILRTSQQFGTILGKDSYIPTKDMLAITLLLSCFFHHDPKTLNEGDILIRDLLINTPKRHPHPHTLITWHWAVVAPRILLPNRQKRKRNQCLQHYNIYVFCRYRPKIRCAKTAHYLATAKTHWLGFIQP